MRKREACQEASRRHVDPFFTSTAPRFISSFLKRNCMKNTPIHETFVDSQSANIYVRTAGNPEANEVLITLHGGPGLSHRYLRDLEQLARPDLLVVSYD